MKTKKKVLLISLASLLTVGIFGSVLTSKTTKIFDLVKASRDCVSGDHDGYHYDAVDAIKDKDGNVEFWTCCKCHATFTEEPESGQWKKRTIAEAVDGVPTNAYVGAPWVSCGHKGIEQLLPAGQTNNDHSEDTFSNDDEAATFYGTYNGGFIYKVENGESTNRNIIEITMKGTGWKWNDYPAFEITVRDNTGVSFYHKAFHTANYSILNDTLTIFKTDGTQVNSINETNNTDYFIYRFDLRNVIVSERTITSITVVPYNNDKGNPKVTTSIKDITFKYSICGHSFVHGKPEVVEKAFEYQAAGTFVKCDLCGELFSSEITEKAPWLKLNAGGSTSAGVTGNSDCYSITGKEINLIYEIPEEKNGRTDFFVTVSSSSKTYEAFYLAATGDEDFGAANYQFFSPNYGFNHGKAPFVKYVIKDGYYLPYNKEYCTILDSTNYFHDGTETITYVFDLSSEYCDQIKTLKFNGIGAGITTTFTADLRIPEEYPGMRIQELVWDNWNSKMCQKIDNSNTKFTIFGTPEASSNGADIVTLGHVNNRKEKPQNIDDERPIVRMKVKMVKSLDNYDTAGNMQWYVKFNNEQLNFTNASDTFAQKPNIHVTDLNGNLIIDGTRLSNNTWYYIEFNFNAEGQHIQFNVEGVTSWGAGYLLVEDFNTRFTVNGSSFAKEA